MKKFLTIAFTLLVLVAVGGLIYQQYATKHLAAELDTISGTIAAHYQALADDEVASLERTGSLTDGQRLLAKQIRDAKTEIMQTSSIKEKIQIISNVQQALTTLAFAATDTDTEKDPRFSILREEMSEDSSVIDSLQLYNDMAAKWNARTHSLLGSLIGSIANKQADLLPYLKFDGSQEYVPTIQL